MGSNQNIIKLDIKSQQKNLEDISRIDNILEGKHYKRLEKDYIIYKEKDLEGLEGVVTNLRIESDKVIMKRNGNIRARFEFIEDEETIVKYICSAGVLIIKLLTKKLYLKRNAQDNIEKIKIEYFLEFENGEKSFNNIDINISY
ncbi:MAG: DUF1934 domain-containing protein [Andreesenia angusta]|nr:DUF1934 domain-containing protein [Andreesenia angusta]